MIHQEIKAGNARRNMDAVSSDPDNMNGMLGFLGMASPNFVADALMYKMKQKMDGVEPGGSVGVYQMGGQQGVVKNELYDCSRV